MLETIKNEYVEVMNRYKEVLISAIKSKMVEIKVEFDRLEDSQDFYVTMRRDGSQSDYYSVQTVLEYNYDRSRWELTESMAGDNSESRAYNEDSLSIFDIGELENALWQIDDELKRWKGFN